MAPGFQRLVNKWVKISRNAETSHNDGSNHGGKLKSEDHSTRTYETSTACSSYYSGNLIDNGKDSCSPQQNLNPCKRQCQHCPNIQDKVNEYMKITKYFEEIECQHCQKSISDAIQAVESLSMKASENEPMSEDDSWIASDEESMEEESKVGAFLHQIADFLEKKNDIPFDLIELWVPVYSSDIPKLCHAGHLVTSNASRDDNKYEFGHSSMMHSFEPGNGIPGRVFTSGLPMWESDLSNCTSFERREDAKKHGINTCLGLPVDSTIGRIVVIFYTEHQMTRDENLIQFIYNAISSNWNPNPRWIVELDSDTKMDSSPSISTFSNNSNNPPSLQPLSRSSSMSSDSRSVDFEIANLLAEQMPMGDSPLSSGYVALRLILLRSVRSAQEEEIVGILRRSYRGYVVIQRSPQDMALLLVQDYMYIQSSLSRNNDANGNGGIRTRSVSLTDLTNSGST